MANRIRRKSAVVGAVVLAELLSQTAGVAAAAWTYHTRGFSKSGTALDGTQATLAYSQMSNNAGCSIISTTIAGGKQLQAGLAHCNAAAITSTNCTGGPFRFTERYLGSNVYECFVFGGAVGGGASYAAQVSKTSAGTYTSYWGGTPHVSQAGFGTATAYTWGEQFGQAPGCDSSWKVNATVAAWKVRDNNIWVTGTANAYNGDNFTCWTISNQSNSGYTIAH